MACYPGSTKTFETLLLEAGPAPDAGLRVVRAACRR